MEKPIFLLFREETITFSRVTLFFPRLVRKLKEEEEEKEGSGGEEQKRGSIEGGGRRRAKVAAGRVRILTRISLEELARRRRERWEEGSWEYVVAGPATLSLSLFPSLPRRHGSRGVANPSLSTIYQ